mmetsp:Transcript_31362/g.73152  ORF Transcript_31362/g.73152 Transcript_31362/m.73152 type:complete len:287 (+) Transcript_31362:165-1025(+)
MTLKRNKINQVHLSSGQQAVEDGVLCPLHVHFHDDVVLFVKVVNEPRDHISLDHTELFALVRVCSRRLSTTADTLQRTSLPKMEPTIPCTYSRRDECVSVSSRRHVVGYCGLCKSVANQHRRVETCLRGKLLQCVLENIRHTFPHPRIFVERGASKTLCIDCQMSAGARRWDLQIRLWTLPIQMSNKLVNVRLNDRIGLKGVHLPRVVHKPFWRNVVKQPQRVGPAGSHVQINKTPVRLGTIRICLERRCLIANKVHVGPSITGECGKCHHSKGKYCKEIRPHVCA